MTEPLSLYLDSRPAGGMTDDRWPGRCPFVICDLSSVMHPRRHAKQALLLLSATRQKQKRLLCVTPRMLYHIEREIGAVCWTCDDVPVVGVAGVCTN
jgi:hypothetical protein